MLTQNELKKLLIYNPNTGRFKWLINKGRGRAGTVAGKQYPLGYISIGINGKHYLAHRLAWLYMTGEWPEDMIDHINGKSTDNRFVNLRSADRCINNGNLTRCKITNQTGYLGVYFHKQTGRYCAQIGTKHLGMFATAEEASTAYQQANKKYNDKINNTNLIKRR